MAVKLGAIEIDRYKLVEIIKSKRAAMLAADQAKKEDA
jgi:hypothetical protein